MLPPLSLCPTCEQIEYTRNGNGLLLLFVATIRRIEEVKMNFDSSFFHIFIELIHTLSHKERDTNKLASPKYDQFVNCSASVDPASAVVDDCPPEMTSETSSK